MTRTAIVSRSMLACAVATVLCAANAAAADLAVDARIDAVKLYQEGATVARRAQVAIPSGEHRLIVRGLPATIDADTLRLALASADVRLGGIEVEKITDKEFVGAQERELRARLDALAERRTALQDEIATAETQLKLLDSLAAAPGGGSERPAVDAANLGAVLTTMSSSSATARARIRAARLSQRELDKDIAKLDADLKKIATARKATCEVRAVLHASAAVNVPLTVEYTIQDAGWHWVYEARLDTAAKRVTLARQASVAQNSGEDWSDATLTLTTARPAADVATPQVASLFLSLQEQELRRKLNMNAMPMAESPVAVEDVVVTGSRRPRMPVVATDYLAEYQVPGRVRLDADGEPHLYPVAEDEVGVDLIARVMPAMSHSAYLEALFRFEGEVPMQGGEMQLFRDGAFVGNASLDSLLPGADVRLPFGADERIRVLVRDEAKESGERGLVSRQHVDEHRQRFEVTNYHSIPIAIEVVDRLPVSEDKGVRIETLKGASEPAVKDLDGRAGILLWKMIAQPRQAATIRHYYAVRYPADRELVARGEDP
jgi:uncharacterized protein (TIGR02231 family)